MGRHFYIALVLLALQTLPSSAKSFLDNVELFRSSRKIESVVDRTAWVIADAQSHQVKYNTNLDRTALTRRNDEPAAAAFNEAAFNKTATQACTQAVNNYSKAVNPTGIVVCYNIAFYDNTTGIFETDVRFYQKDEPSGDFADANASDYLLGMSIPEASLSSPMSIMQSSVAASKPAKGQFLQGFQNIGQVNDGLTLSDLTVSDLRVLMIPTITMAIEDATTQQIVNTTLSSDILSYVAGELVQTGGTPTNITNPVAAAEASPIVSSVSKFVLPGTHIQIYPTGLIITCIWTGLLGLAVGLGTFGRYRFRQHYRARVRRAMNGKP